MLALVILVCHIHASQRSNEDAAGCWGLRIRQATASTPRRIVRPILFNLVSPLRYVVSMHCMGMMYTSRNVDTRYVSQFFALVEPAGSHRLEIQWQAWLLNGCAQQFQ